jgi:hypothetical protein
VLFLQFPFAIDTLSDQAVPARCGKIEVNLIIEKGWPILCFVDIGQGI